MNTTDISILDKDSFQENSQVSYYYGNYKIC